jgi:hypothetical protein
MDQDDYISYSEYAPPGLVRTRKKVFNKATQVFEDRMFCTIWLKDYPKCEDWLTKHHPRDFGVLWWTSFGRAIMDEKILVIFLLSQR